MLSRGRVAAGRSDPAPTSALGSSLAAGTPPIATENTLPAEVPKPAAPPTEPSASVVAEPARGKAPVVRAVTTKPHAVPPKTTVDDLLLDRK